ncbi:MAG: hypothetical protein GX455_05860 [Phycisphaerae bacterium]|nr:hypothetical protein [Phycisphaerae bacterium]
MMKDIDFIPDWYRTGRQRKVSYRRQYTMILCLFGILAAWSFISGLSVSRGRAEVSRREQTFQADESINARFEGLKKELTALMDVKKIVDRVDPRADFAASLAELSHVAGQRIILRSLEVESEKYIPDKQKDQPTMITLGSGNSESKSVLPEMDLRYRFKLTGIAADAADVAALISALEKSPFFCQILPGFSKTIQVKEYPVTEFEVSCYLKNYSLMK